MPRYIDADKAIAIFKEAQQKTDNIIEITSLIGSMAVIDSCQTEDVAPVVHAKLIIADDGYVRCTACGKAIRYPLVSFDDIEYCPKCAAKIDKEEKENEQHNKS